MMEPALSTEKKTNTGRGRVAKKPYQRPWITTNPPHLSTHLVDIELVLPPRQLSVAGGELTNEVMAADKTPIKGQ